MPHTTLYEMRNRRLQSLYPYPATASQPLGIAGKRAKRANRGRPPAATTLAQTEIDVTDVIPMAVTICHSYNLAAQSKKLALSE
jgi:hypothetical protein